MNMFKNPIVERAAAWLVQTKEKAIDLSKYLLKSIDRNITTLGDWVIRTWNSVNPTNTPPTSFLAKVPVFGYHLPESWNKGVGYGLTAFAAALTASIAGSIGMGTATKGNAKILEEFKNAKVYVELKDVIVVGITKNWKTGKEYYTIAKEPSSYYDESQKRKMLVIRIAGDQEQAFPDLKDKNAQIDHIQIPRATLEKLIQSPLQATISLRGKISSYNDEVVVLDTNKKWTMYDISLI